MPTNCVFCNSNLEQSDIDGGYHCCSTCYDNRGGDDDCYEGCMHRTCPSYQEKNEEDPLGW
jgi:hypothetical protein